MSWTEDDDEEVHAANSVNGNEVNAQEEGVGHHRSELSMPGEFARKREESEEELEDDLDEEMIEDDEMLEEDAGEDEGDVEEGEEETENEENEESDIEAEEHKVEEMWQGKSNVLVAVRVRPMNSRESQTTRNVVKVVDEKMVVVLDRVDTGKKRQRQDVLRKNRSREKRYAFDFAFGPEVPTHKVYCHTTKFLIDGVVIGYNATVFAYGATGAGKTHTMLGGAMQEGGFQPTASTPSSDPSASNHGIMVLTLRDLFHKITENIRKSRRILSRQSNRTSQASPSTGAIQVIEDTEEEKVSNQKDNHQEEVLNTEENHEQSVVDEEVGNDEDDDDEEENEEANSRTKQTPASTTSSSSHELGLSYKVSCSFLEVYNEMIRDLLTPSSEYLDLREDPVKGPTVTGLSEVEANCAEDVMNLLRKGNSRRTTEGTAANQASSRSHAVLQITVERRDNGVNSNAVAVSNVTIGKLSLIDLAGSERASVTQNRGIRLVEGANINRSLLALGNCINALREGGKGAFVPYRDSKLTRLLKDSLGGNCRTVMIAAVSPARNQIEETLNTLKYANRAKNIKTQAERNVLNVDYHVTEYVNLISRLKTEITSLRNQLKRPPPVSQQGQPLTGGFANQLVGKSAVSVSGVSSNGGTRKSVEKQQMALLREQVVLNFKERMQLCRSLIEIEAQNIANNSELELHNLVIQRWEESLDKRVALAQQHGHDQNSVVEGDPDLDGALEEDTLEGSSIRENQKDHESQDGSDREVDDDVSEYENDNDQDEGDGDGDFDEDEENKVKNKGAQDDADADDERDDAEITKRRNRSTRTKRSLSVITEPPNVRSARTEAQQLQRANLKNSQLKLDIERRLRENEKASSALRNQMETRITTEERRELMELEYRIGMLELENMELERSRMLHRCSMQYKDMLIKRLLTQLEVRDTIIDEQRKLLDDHGVGTHTVEGVLEEHISGLESLHMLQSIPTGVPATPGTPTPRHLMLGGVYGRASIRPISGSVQHQQHIQRKPSTDPAPPMPHAARVYREKRLAAFGPNARSSMYGLPSPVTGCQVVPMHRLEEELARIEMNHPYTPLDAATREKNIRSKSSNNNEDDSDAEDGMNSSRATSHGTSSRLEGGRRKTKSLLPPAGATAIDKEKRRQRRLQAGVLHQGVHQKKSHPYLRQQLLQKKVSKEASKSQRVKGKLIQEDSIASVSKKEEKLKKMRSGSVSAASGSFSNNSGGGGTGASTNQPPAAPIRSSSSLTNQVPGPMRSRIKRSAQIQGKVSKGKKTSLSQQMPRNSRFGGDHQEEKCDHEQTVENPTRSHLSLPPIKLSSNNIANSCNFTSKTYLGQSTHTGVESPYSARHEDEDNFFGERSAAVAPAPPFSPCTPTEERVHSGRSTSSQESTRFHQVVERKEALNRLNSKIASGASFENRESEIAFREEDEVYPEEESELSARRPGLRQSSSEEFIMNQQDALELMDAANDSCEEAPVASLNTQALKEAKKAEKKERKKLEKRWAELGFVLRKTIRSEHDFENIRRTAERSLTFLDQLDQKANELNVLRGTLSRLLLPYSEDTAAADQRANTPVTGDSPLDSVMDLKTRRQMVTHANDLRSLVRVKIADDADLDQARTAVSEVKTFFEKIDSFASRKNLSPFEVFSSLKAR